MWARGSVREPIFKASDSNHNYVIVNKRVLCYGAWVDEYYYSYCISGLYWIDDDSNSVSNIVPGWWFGTLFILARAQLDLPAARARHADVECFDHFVLCHVDLG